MILDRAIPRLVAPRTVTTMPDVAAAPRVLAYFERNRARLEPVSPAWAEGFFTTAYWERRLVNAREEFFQDQSVRLFVFERGHEDGAVIGAISFTQIFRLSLQRCILGYSIDEAHEGRGMLREALESSIHFVFSELELHRIEANYIPTNERSGNLLRRLGFTVEGYARDYLYLGGRWRDHVLTARTNPRPITP